MPSVVLDLAAGAAAELVWRNELGGLTFRVGDRYVKWNPRRTGIDLERERQRLEWIATRHPAPRVLASGADDDAQWLVTAALPGEPAVGDAWRARRCQRFDRLARTRGCSWRRPTVMSSVTSSASSTLDESGSSCGSTTSMPPVSGCAPSASSSSPNPETSCTGGSDGEWEETLAQVLSLRCRSRDSATARCGCRAACAVPGSGVAHRVLL